MIAGTSGIVATNLTRRFGARTAVEQVSFNVERSEIVALLGPNGAGKTTTMRMLAGLIAPTGGTVAIGGITMSRTTGSLLRSRIGFLTEAPGLWDRLTVRENLEIYARLYGVTDHRARIDRLLELFELGSHADARAAELSKGTRQKVALGRTLLHEPTVLLLDEPTSGLDPEVARALRRLLDERRAAGCAILLSTHNLDEAERLADRVAVLHHRLLAIDPPATLRQRLTTGRLFVRVGGDAAAYLEIVRRFDPRAAVDGARFVLTPGNVERDTPDLVAALVAGGARVLEVTPEVPALEDVYLHLVGDRS